MLGEPLNSPYDLSFNLLGFRVRVTWLFWVVTAAFGWNWANGFDVVFRGQSPGAFVFLVIWIAAVFLSILVHEMGHTFAMRYYGIESHIVLYHFGGLAIPSAFRRYRVGAPQRNGYSPQAQLVISLAGPVAQILLAVVFMGIALALGYPFHFSSWVEWMLGPNMPELKTPDDPTFLPSLYALLNFVIFPSIYWALLNLLPVLPLDGGRIAQHALTMYLRRDGIYEATVLSIVVSLAVAVWGFQNGQQFLGIMFLMLGFSSFQNLQGGMRGF